MDGITSATAGRALSLIPSPIPAGAKGVVPAAAPGAPPLKPAVDLMVWTPLDAEASPETTAEAQAFSDRIAALQADKTLDPQTRQARMQDVRQAAQQRQTILDPSGQAVTDHGFCAAWFRAERKRQADREAQIQAAPVTPQTQAAAADRQAALDADAFAKLGLEPRSGPAAPSQADDPKWDPWIDDPGFIRAGRMLQDDRVAARATASDYAQAARAAAAPAPTADPSDRLSRLEPRQQDLVYALAHATAELAQTRTTADVYLTPKLADPDYRGAVARAYGADMARVLAKLDQRDLDACNTQALAQLGGLSRLIGAAPDDLMAADGSPQGFSLERFGAKVAVAPGWAQATVTPVGGPELRFALRNIGLDLPEALVGYAPPQHGWRSLNVTEAP
jgi:hypothetical protein